MKSFFVFITLITLLLVHPAQAENSDEQNIEQLKQQLQTLNSEDTSLDGIRTIYRSAISALESRILFSQQAVENRQQIERQADQVQALKMLAAMPQPAGNQENYNGLSLLLLEQERNLTKAELVSLESETAQYRKKIDQFGGKQVSLRNKLTALRQQQNELELPVSPSFQINSETQRIIENALFSSRLAELEALELELLALPGTRDISALELQIKDAELKQKQQRLVLIETAIKLQRRLSAEQTISQTEHSEQEDQNHPPILHQLKEQNTRLQTELRATVAASEKTTTITQQLNQQLIKLGGNYRSIQQQLELDISYVGSELRRLMLKLSQPVNTRQTLRLINKARLRSIELNEQQQLLLNNNATNKNLTTTHQQRYIDLLADQKKLTEQLSQLTQQHIAELSQLLSIQQQFNTQITQSLTLLDRHLLWVPSVPAVNMQWLIEVQHDLQQFAQQLTGLVIDDIFSWRKRFGAELLITLVLLIISNMLLRYKHRHQLNWHKQIGNVKHDSLNHTLSLLFIAPVIALPIPYLLFATSQYGLHIEHPTHQLFVQYLQITASMTWIAHTLHIWLRAPDGLFHAHFGIPVDVVQLIRKQIIPTWLISLPLLFCAMATDQMSEGSLRSGLGRIFFICICALIMLLWFNLWNVSSSLNQLVHSNRWWLRAKPWLSILILFQFTMLIIAIAGYLFTAGILTLALLVAIAMTFVVFLLYRLGRRWLLIEERNLAFTRALTKRAEILAARENKEEEPPIKENYLDLETISEQSLTLLKAIMFSVLIALLWLTLGDLLPSLDVLDSIELWTSNINTSDGTVLETVSFQDFLLATFLLAICLLAAYNLPGLLELLILRHLPLAPGSSYAITTLIKYVLVLIGMLSGFSQLGVEWEKLQWLVAALSVGLGFGLQEIVANFVSGLIILFEKPIRIGDTVTIRGLTGTVSRIQIRATTISDWDKKEVVIPNKTFITEQLINWSLSDAVTRVVIPFSVHLGADPALVRSILLEVARKNDRVLNDPPSEAFFLAFAERSMSFEIRVYVSSMTDRLEVTHELNSAITEELTKENIQLSRPQLQIEMMESTLKE